MTRFRYIVIDPGGRKRSGHIEANDKKHAEKLLLANDDLLVELEEASNRKYFKLERRQNISEAIAAEFGIELSGLLSAGAPLRRALDIQSEGTTQTAMLAQNIRNRIDSGLSLSEALRESGGGAHLLSEFAAAGEAGAGLERLLATGAQFLDTKQRAISELKNALAYPLFIVLLALIALAAITLYVAPALAPTLKESGQGWLILNLATLGTWTKEHASMGLLLIAGIITFAFFTTTSKQVSRRLNGLMWRMPLIGSIAKDMDVGQSCAVMSALLEAGRPLESSLRFAAAVSGPNLSYIYSTLALQLRDGLTASSVFSNCKVLPVELRRLAILGEQSSTLGRAIGQAGVICHDRALRRIQRLSKIAGPTLVIGLGVAIAGLMLSVISSLSSIGDSVL